MRLSITGAFVRAAKNARLGVASNQRGPALVTVTVRQASTSAGSNSTVSRSGHDEKPLGIDIRTVSKEHIPGASTPQSRFKEFLQTEADVNKIVTNVAGLSGAKILNQSFVFDDASNLSPSILELVGRNLYDTPNHPLHITRKLIESVFNYPTYKNHVATNPVVTTEDNFDVLGFPADHPGRSKTDTYYVDSTHVLRTHTSAHQHAAFQYMSKNPEAGYTICADVYRRDSIDRSHFPVFHQMEGAYLWALPPPSYPNETRFDRQTRRYNQMIADLEALPKSGLKIVDSIANYDDKTNPIQINHDKKETLVMCQHLQRSLEILIAKVFTAAKKAGVGNVGDDPIKIRWIEAYFPFTSPSYEVEVWWQGEWLEILGCGTTQQSILNNAGLPDRIGWAWGIGIERLAMLLFGIPDIRLFWSKDERFLSQFEEGKITRYTPFSKYPPCYKDVAFWLPSTSPTATPVSAPPSPNHNAPVGVAAAAGGDATKSLATATVPSAFHENDLMEVVRDVAGSLAEDVKLVDEFVNPKNGNKSLCYRINYRSLEKTLTNSETNSLHDDVKKELKRRLGVSIR